MGGCDAVETRPVSNGAAMSSPPLGSASAHLEHLMSRRVLVVSGTPSVVLALAVTVATSYAQATRGPAARNACMLFTNGEIETATGTTVRSSRPGSVPEGSECRYQTRAGFSLTITLSAVDPKDFDELRSLFGGDAQPVTGVGDGAYFLQNERIYARIGRTQFVASRGSGADAKFRDALLALAKLAAPRLR
jgi:hypothetical protein